MKKYYSLSAASLSLSALAFLAGCQDYEGPDGGVEAQKQHYLKQQNAAYTDAFTQAFGESDPEHTWGMDEEIGAIEGLSSVSTRAGIVEVNRNQWTEFDSKSEVDFPTYNNAPKNKVKVPNYRISALGHDIQIPGFPHLNGLYYTINNGILGDTKTGDDITSGSIPAGDVTPYEIQYVSAWFRTHKNPKSNVKLHLTDFFIQNVSCDYDQVDYNPLSTPYKAGWTMTGNNGANIATAAQAKAHKAWDGSDYVVNKNLNEPISYDLDYLGFLDMNNEWTHVNNFNRGNSNFSPEDSKSNPNREIKYIKSSGTEDFSCHPSWCTNTDTIKTWVLVHLTWTETVKDSNSPYPVGTKIPREGYYLGFDFHGIKSGQEIKRDGYYSNWIVKITPGHFTETGKSRRIFCEDLGGSYDFDFNDAVVDVAFESKNGKYEPIICVQAAGGTMPIYIEKQGANYELHKMLEAPVTTPVNVDNKTRRSVAIYRGNEVSGTNPGQIKIYVKNTRDDQEYQISGKKDDGEDDERSWDDKENESTLTGSTYDDTSKKAPRAFSAPTSVVWPGEEKKIDNAYEKFPKWVKKESGGTGWYNTVSNPGLLFAAAFKEEDAEHHNSQVADGGYDPITIDWTALTPDAAQASLNAAQGVKADSYLKIEDYTGPENSVFSNLNQMTANDRVTFVVVMSSNTLFVDKADGSQNVIPLQGILVPADISVNNSTYSMSYNGHDFNVNSLNRFNSAAYVQDIHETGFGTYAYTIQFSFSKSDLVKSQSGGTTTYYDYVLLFLKVGNGQGKDGFYPIGDTPTYTTSGSGATAKVESSSIHDVTIHKWYVHY